MNTSDIKNEPSHWISFKTWRTELLFAVPITALVIALYYNWFALRDRYFVFLYYHNMGSGFDTTPFGWVTVSRYWMSGLVAGGAVMVPYLVVNFILGRAVKAYHAPVWWRVWILCAIPLLIIVPAIVMTANVPVLPPINAAQVTAALLTGLALAVVLGKYAANSPTSFILLMVDGGALACILMALRAANNYQHWISRGSIGIIYRFLAVLGFGIGLLVIMTIITYWWRKVKIPDLASWLAAGAGLHYLFLPIYHHLFWCKDFGSWTDPDYFSYIPDADNYFARNVPFQIVVWITVALLVFGLTRLRLRLRQRRNTGHPG